MAEWFRAPGYRGCAFINGVSEIAPALPQVSEITRRHKTDMQKAIAALLPPGRRRESLARALALVVDGRWFDRTGTVSFGPRGGVEGPASAGFVHRW
jgi:hypothetical protein